MADLPPKYRKVLGQLAPEEREVLTRCLLDKDDSAQRISDVLKNHDIPISPTTLKLARKALVSA